MSGSRPVPDGNSRMRPDKTRRLRHSLSMKTASLSVGASRILFSAVVIAGSNRHADINDRQDHQIGGIRTIRQLAGRSADWQSNSTAFARRSTVARTRRNPQKDGSFQG